MSRFETQTSSDATRAVNIPHGQEATDNVASQKKYKTRERHTDNDLVIGRRVVNIEYFIQQLQELGVHSPVGCSFKDMQVIGEITRGLRICIQLKCRICNFLQDVWTDKVMDIDDAASVSGATTAEVKEELCDDSTESEDFQTGEMLEIEKYVIWEAEYEQDQLQLQDEHDETHEELCDDSMELEGFYTDETVGIEKQSICDEEYEQDQLELQEDDETNGIVMSTSKRNVVKEKLKNIRENAFIKHLATVSKKREEYKKKRCEIYHNTKRIGGKKPAPSSSPSEASPSNGQVSPSNRLNGTPSQADVALKTTTKKRENMTAAELSNIRKLESVRQRRRYEKIKNDPVQMAARKEYWRKRYCKKKKDGLIKSIAEMTATEKARVRKVWRTRQTTCRKKKKEAAKMMKFVEDYKPPDITDV